MPFVDLDGRRIEVREGDSIASALWRAGVRVFARSFKYRRPRAPYCGTGDCPSCLLTVDGEPGIRSCCTPARDGQRITRDIGWPSADYDLLAGLWRFARLLPVGTPYKTFIRPRAAWTYAERILRRFTGIGRVDARLVPSARRTIHHHPDLLVVGGGVAGLAAALTAGEAGQTVVLAEEHGIGEKIAPGPVRDRVAALCEKLRACERVTVLERAAAIGIYEGPLVPVTSADVLHQVHPARVVLATGAVERHAVFDGSDLPGVWLGRGAARLAGVHGVKPGDRIVFAGTTAESLAHLDTLVAADCRVVAALLPASLADRAPRGIVVVPGGSVVGARGPGKVTTAIVESPSGRETLSCDSIVLSLGLEPRDGLLRQAAVPSIVAVAGEALRGEMDLAAAEESGREAGLRSPVSGVRIDSGSAGSGHGAPGTVGPKAGFVCLCEDVTASDFSDSWDEGFRSTEILKRYSKATAGPCQGALCHPHLRSFIASRGGEGWVARATTARPPIRPIRMEDAAAGVYHLTEQRTALHQRHLEAGASMELTGPWMRPQTYGDVTAEYWAVRRGVSVMDVSTLGKYLVAGKDAAEFLERLYPCNVRDIAEGRLRYALLLNDAGHVIDDGLIGSLGPAGYNLTFTSSGADGIESWLRDWIETWNLKVHVVNQTAATGAINVAGPRARELLQRLTQDPIDGASLAYSRQREITVAGIRCNAMRVGFVGELSIELHHPRSRSVELWDALLQAGADMGIRPHGMDALRLLRLEKGHILIGQDTDFDTTPSKLGLDWAVKMTKPFFVGRAALERIATATMAQKLVPIMFTEGPAPAEGAALSVKGRNVGYLTSCRFSHTLRRGVGLGWVRRDQAGFPTAVTADGIHGTVIAHAFYDPKGERLRA